MRLDLVVMETRGVLVEEDWELSLHVVKATIQVARWVVQESDDQDTPALVTDVRQGLLTRGVMLQREQVQAILTAYARVIALLDILEINELGL